jgi:signal transduction protein with GAF and PtsI domain
MPVKGSSYKEYLKALSEISRAITSDRYIEDILKLIVTVAANAMKAEICSLWLLDQEKGELNLRATQSMSEDYVGKRSFRLGNGIVGCTAESRQPMVIENVLEDERYVEKKLAKKEGLVSMLSVPMVAHEKVCGVFICYTNKPYAFTQSDIDMLQTIANQAAVAIENTELMVKTRVIQEELESRKKVEKAKGILMKEKGLTEEEAFNLIRKSSMNKRVTMKDVAEAIILSAEIG